MKHYSILFFILIFFSACDPTYLIEDETLEPEYLFDINALPEITIETSTAEWNKLLSYFDQNPNNEEYILSNFIFTKNGTTHQTDSAGLRIRGNTSRRRPEGSKNETHNSEKPDWHHASFTVKFNEYVKGKELAKVEKLNLKWFKDDAMYVREIYCYDLFERFGVWTAPQASYCRLSIKINEDAAPAYFGVYMIGESVDNDYLKQRKGKLIDTNGFLWKASWGADFLSADKSKMGVESNTLTSSYEPIYDLKNNTEQLEKAKTQLSNFIVNLNSKTGADFKTWIDSTMDVDLFIRTYAVNVMCGMWDDYWNNKNNFYFYFDTKGKFYFIPYDYDNTLGTSFLMENSGTQNLLKWGKSNYPLVTKILKIPEYETLYKSYLKQLANSNNDLFHVNKSVTRIRNWHNMIRDYIPNDTGEDMSLIDQPASWGNCGFYKLLETNNNFFSIRAQNIPE